MGRSLGWRVQEGAGSEVCEEQGQLGESWLLRAGLMQIFKVKEA